MRKEIIEVYSYEELSDKAKEVARKEYREMLDNSFHFESEMITEGFEYTLDEMSYPTNDIAWSLSYCQGDGVAFYGSISCSMLEEIIKRNKEMLSVEQYELYNYIVDNNYAIFANISRNSYGNRYSHWNTMDIEVESDWLDVIVQDLFELDVECEEEKEKAIEKINRIEELIEDIHYIVSSEVKELSKKLESQGYQEIEYIYSDESVEESIICNDYEFLQDGTRYYQLQAS